MNKCAPGDLLIPSHIKNAKSLDFRVDVLLFVISKTREHYTVIMLRDNMFKILEPSSISQHWVHI